VPKFTASGTIGNSSIFNSATGVGIGTTSPQATFHLVREDANESILLESLYVNTQANAPGFTLQRARGTVASPLPLLSDDVIGGFFAAGYQSGGAFGSNTTAIRFTASQNFTSTAQGTRIEFFTTNNGTTTRTEKLRINDTGNVIIQNGGTFTDAGYRLDVVGTARVSGAATFSSTVSINTTNVVSTLEIGSAESDGTGSTNAIRIQSKTGASNQQLLIGINQTGTYSFLQSSQASVGYKSLSLNPNGGNVGIGTSSPDYKLSVIGNVIIGDNTTNTLRMGSYATESFILSSSAIPLTFYTNATERMRITSGGNVLIGGTSTLGASGTNLEISGGRAQLVVNSTTATASWFSVYPAGDGNTYILRNTGYSFLFGTATNQATAGFSQQMSISSNGSIGAPSGTNIYNASDARLKKNISTTTYGLNTISALNPVKFNWIDGFEPTEDGKDMLGFIAQEMQNIIPEAVESFGSSVDLNGTIISDTLRVNEKFIIPVLVKAIQELSAENTSLINRIEALENK
jgi:hypothetical protein